MTPQEISIEALRQLGADTRKLTITTGDRLIRCPFHKDKTPSFSLNIAKGVCHCFSCHRGGTIPQLYFKETGNSIYKVLGISSGTTDGFKAFSLPVFKEEDFEKLPEVNFTFEGDAIDVDQEPDCLSYLETRGISLRVAKEMGMRFTKHSISTDLLDDERPIKERQIHFVNRLLIPVYENGKILSIEGRAIYDPLPDAQGIASKKVIYPKGSSTSTLFQRDRLNFNEFLYAVEGLMDLAVLRTDPYFQNSTALLGATIKNRQVHFLRRAKKLVYLIDYDRAGFSSLKKLKEELEQDFFVLFPPRYNDGVKDTGDIPKKLKMTVQQCRERNWLNSMKAASAIDCDAMISHFDYQKTISAGADNK